MRVLMAHNYYLEAGGEDESFQAEAAVVESAGHEVTRYTIHNSDIARMSSLRAATRVLWNQESYDDIARLLGSRKHQVAHFQNTFPLMSPSVYYAATEAGVPVIQSLRNYRLACANGLLFRSGAPCEECIGAHAPWFGVVHACYRESRLASAVVAGMVALHKTRGTYANTVNTYVTMTEFAKRTLVRAGIPDARIVVKANFLVTDPGVGDGRGGYALFVGRLSPEKGVATMLAAWARLRRWIPLKVVGDGPLAPALPLTSEGVEWLGRRSANDVLQLMGGAQMLIFPSESYETFGRVAVEAYAKGTPVIASDIGAIAEVVDHGRTGYRFRPGDTEHLVVTVEQALAQPSVLEAMRREARLEYESKYTAEINRRQLLAIYDAAVG